MGKLFLVSLLISMLGIGARQASAEWMMSSVWAFGCKTQAAGSNTLETCASRGILVDTATSEIYECIASLDHNYDKATPHNDNQRRVLARCILWGRAFAGAGSYNIVTQGPGGTIPASYGQVIWVVDKTKRSVRACFRISGHAAPGTGIECGDASF